MAGIELARSDRFARASELPALDAGEIHLWLLADVDALDHREVAAAARATLERLLTHYAALERAPEIVRSERGKPYAPALDGFDFNLSHARNQVLIAIAREQPLGVDIEHGDRRIDVDGLARRFFAPAEADALAALSPALRLAAFQRLWTCKEAVLKALGAGLSFGLHRVAFALDAAGVPTGIAEVATEAGAPVDWQLVLLEPVAGFLGALAWRGAPRRVRMFRAGRDHA